MTLYSFVGTLAGDVNFQVYLLDGLHRWNQDRERDALETERKTEPLSYDGVLRHSVNKLSQDLLKKDFCQDFSTPRKYTGTFILMIKLPIFGREKQI